MVDDWCSMEDGNGQDNGISRRKLLGLVGAGAVGAAGLTGGSGIIRGAEAGPQKEDGEVRREIRKATQEERKTALQSEEVQAILSELGNPAVQRGKSKRIIVTIGTRTIHATTLSTQFGGIFYATTDSGTEEASFTFGNGVLEESTEQSAKDHELPKKYQAAPTDAGAKIVVGADNEPIFVRSATSSEKDQISQLTGISTKDMITGISSRSGAFRVSSSNDLDTVYEIELDADTAVFHEQTESDFDSATAERVVRAQRPSCYTLCKDCVAGIVGIANCQIACGPLIVFAQLPGLLACVACAAATGALTGYTCSRCAGWCL